MNSSELLSSFSKEEASSQDLSRSGYAQVIFSDLYFNFPGSLGCKFQITASVDEHPDDFIGLFRVGYESLDQCIISKPLSAIEYKNDVKFRHCSFQTQSLPPLESGFYQFLYITRSKEVCGASMPFEMKMPKPVTVAEEVVMETIEDDFLVVGSTLAEQNQELMSKIMQMNENVRIKHEEFAVTVQKMEAEKRKLGAELKLALADKEKLSAEYNQVLGEKDEVNKANDERIKRLEEEIKAITLNVESTCEAFKQMEQEKLGLEREKERLSEEKKSMDAALCTVTKQYKVASSSLEKLQKELKLKESMLESSQVSLASQLENAQQMIEALEDSKKLAHAEIAKLTESILKLKSNQEQLKKQNIYLEGKMKDLYVALEKNEHTEIELHLKVKELEIKLKEAKGANEKLHDANKACMQRILDLETRDKPIQSVNQMKCKILALELQLKDSKLIIEKLKKKKEREHKAISVATFVDSAQEVKPSCSQDSADAFNDKQLIVEKKLFTAKSVTDEQKILNTSCGNQNSASSNCQCKELQKELNEKIAEISRMKEECIKKDAVVEFLAKDKNCVQQNSTIIAEALKDSVLRLKEASDIYKAQYLEIEKLKKKLKKYKSSRKIRSSVCSSTTDDLGSAAAIREDALPECMRSAQHAPSSDSDTGEHVSGQCANESKLSVMAAAALPECLQIPVQIPFVTRESSGCFQELGTEKFRDMFGQSLDVGYLGVASGGQESPARVHESPAALQSLVDRNLAEFSSSKSSTEELFALPCPVCNSDIGVSALSSDDMIKHLEVQHRQSMCPVCGKLFDMNLPSKYLQYHVEDHFMKIK